MMTFFPSRRPKLCEGSPEGERAEVRMSVGAVYTTCVCVINADGRVSRGKASVRNDAMYDKDETVRLKNKIVKLSFYRASLAHGISKPEWGALTGVRPVKLMSVFLRQSDTERSALRGFRREFLVSEERANLALEAARVSERARLSLAERDFCLYVSIPFCPTRCSYCSFVSQSTEKSVKLIPPYLEALHREIEATAQAVREAGLRPVALYIGGGTPTTLSAKQLELLIAKLYREFDLSHLREFTVEAGRPETIDSSKIQVLGNMGVTRVCVNPQTMNNAVLETIGRRHTAEDIERATELVRSCGNFSVNTDLIAGLPGDDPDSFEKSIKRVLRLAPENVTVHTLSKKRGSRLIREQGIEQNGGDDVTDMLERAYKHLRASDYAPYYIYRQKFMAGGYENSGWSVAGQESLYNVCIMDELCTIISMGAGGSTKLIRGTGVERSFAPKYPKEYIEAVEKTSKGKKMIEEFYYGI